MPFIRLQNGQLINTRFVAKASPVDLHYRLFHENGEALGDTTDELSEHIVPAAAGTIATVFTLYDEDGKEDVETEKVPVVAWRISGDYASPIFISILTSNQLAMMEMPDGRYCCPNDTSVPDLDEAIEFARTRLRGR